MKTLILAEKPSVARDFASALKVPARGHGYFENQNTIITWAIGHLMELKEPEEYDKKWRTWNLGTLPVLPDRLSYKANSKTKKQYSIVLKQIQRKDIGKIVLATDAGREGELIGRTLINQAKPKASLFRFWTSQALSPSVIKENMNSLSPLSSYDRLYYSGRARQSADWLVGMNLSRLATIKMGDLFSVGRVQTAVLALLVKKRDEIDQFKPESYFILSGKFNFKNGEIRAQWFDPSKKNENTHLRDKKRLDAIIKSSQGKIAIVSQVQKEKKSFPSPQLFSLTELQKVANRRYGFSAKKTLSLAQSLYEKHKCLSYPRTDARVLGTKSFGQVQKLINVFKKDSPEHFKYFDDKKVSLKNRQVFNDEKLTDHHALIPLKNTSLNGDESKVFDLVLKRFVAAFSKNFEYEETKVVIKVEKENFKARGQKIVCLGWRHLSGGDKELILPAIEKNETGVVIDLKPESKKTQPPPEYTDSSLLQDMINPSRLVDEKELKQVFRGEVGLGTQATRAQIIETLIFRKYIKRNGKSLVALARGQELVKNLKKLPHSGLLTHPEETAKWELDLENISQGQGNPKDFMLRIRKFVSDCTEEWKSTSFDKVQRKEERQNDKTQESIGTCPICKGPVIESPKSFSCKNWRDGCKFTIWKKIAGKKISKNQAKTILKNGKSAPLKGFKSKTGKKFNASLVINDSGVEFSF
jgi:DNA topoisomerase-3